MQVLGDYAGKFLLDFFSSLDDAILCYDMPAETRMHWIVNVLGMAYGRLSV